MKIRCEKIWRLSLGLLLFGAAFYGTASADILPLKKDRANGFTFVKVLTDSRMVEVGDGDKIEMQFIKFFVCEMAENGTTEKQCNSLGPDRWFSLHDLRWMRTASNHFVKVKGYTSWRPYTVSSFQALGNKVLQDKDVVTNEVDDYIKRLKDVLTELENISIEMDGFTGQEFK